MAYEQDVERLARMLSTVDGAQSGEIGWQFVRPQHQQRYRAYARAALNWYVITRDRTPSVVRHSRPIQLALIWLLRRASPRTGRRHGTFPGAVTWRAMLKRDLVTVAPDVGPQTREPYELTVDGRRYAEKYLAELIKNGDLNARRR